MKTKTLWHVTIEDGEIVVEDIKYKSGINGDAHNLYFRKIPTNYYSKTIHEKNINITRGYLSYVHVFSHSRSKALKIMSGYINDKLSQLSIETTDYFRYLSDVSRLKGEFGIGVFNMKTEKNYGTLFRSAYSFGASYIFLIGKRFKQQPTNTYKSERHVPLYEYETVLDFMKHMPCNTRLIGVEITDDAENLIEFNHPQQACYILGAEDNGLTQEITHLCDGIVQIPGMSLNVATAGSIVMYDRIAKGEGK